MTREDLDRVHDFLLKELKERGATIDALYHCPHDAWERCACRKPEPGLILTASKDLNIDPTISYTVGDSPSDVAAGRGAGTRTVLIGREKGDNADLVFPSLLDFARYLRDQEQARLEVEQASKVGVRNGENG
jgi:D-glycero-D-manno-heptose 1,7-bisphosphate phosphatase